MRINVRTKKYTQQHHNITKFKYIKQHIANKQRQ